LPELPKTIKKRALILNYEFPPLGGGAANATYYLLKEFGLRPDLEVTLITSSVNEERVESFTENCTIHYLDIGKNGNIHYQSQADLLKYSWKAYRRSKALIRQNSFDVVHAFFGIPCGFIAMNLGLPYIVSLRGSDVPFYNRRFYWQDKILFKRLSKLIWRKASFVVANSSGLAQLAVKSAQKQSVSIIPNGIDNDAFETALPGSREGSIQLISTGRLIPRKGYDLLIEAMAGIPELSARIIGDGPEKERLQKLAEELKVQIEFLGSMDHKEIPALLSKADLFVLPSFNEGMSNAALEALAAGLPVILTDVGGSVELIENNGWIIDPHSVDQLRTSLKDAIAKKESLKDLGIQSKRIAQRMSWSNVANAYFELY